MNPAIVARLRDVKQNAWEAAKALREQAIADHRDLTASEQEQWNTYTREIDDANARLSDIFSLEARAQKADGFRDLAAGILPTDHTRLRRTGSGEIRDMLLNHEQSRDFDVVGSLQKFALGTGSSTLSVSDFSDRVAMYMRTLSPWLALSTIVRADQGRPLIVPTITTDSTMYKPGEGTAITESTPTTGSVTATPVSYKSLSYWSAEADEDAEFDIEDALARSAARSIALASGSDFTAAVLAGVNNAGTAIGTPFFSLDDLITTEYTRAAPYREAGSWVGSNSALVKIRKFKDSQNQYLWQPNQIVGQPPTLMGSPIFEDPYLATVGSASKSAVFGDMRAALVIKMTPLRVELSRDFRFDTDQVALKTVLRAGLAVQDPAAAGFLVSGNS